jgi:hypothetical protein
MIQTIFTNVLLSSHCPATLMTNRHGRGGMGEYIIDVKFRSEKMGVFY